MKTLNFGKICVLAAFLATLGTASVAGAQSVRHDLMDAQAVRADIAKLKMERRKALRYKNWGKVAQEDRLIAADKLWLMKDKHKIRRAGG